MLYINRHSTQIGIQSSHLKVFLFHQQPIVLLSGWRTLNTLVISAWLDVWLVNCIRFNWIFVGFFILIISTKCSLISFFSKISPLVLFLQYKNILISNDFHRENPSFLWGIGRYVLCGRLSEISAELECMHYYSLLLYRIHLLLLLLLLVFIVII